MRGFIAFAAALTAAVLSLTARAIDPSVAPNFGGIGQSVALTQLGFSPVKKPKVKLVPHFADSGLKPAGMKVTAFTETKIDATVTGGRAGEYDVTVKPGEKGGATVTLPDT